MAAGRKNEPYGETILDNLIPINDEALERAKIPVKARTLYGWRSAGKKPEIFVKIGGKLFVNRKEFIEMVEKAMEAQKRKRRGR